MNFAPANRHRLFSHLRATAEAEARALENQSADKAIANNEQPVAAAADYGDTRRDGRRERERDAVPAVGLGRDSEGRCTAHDDDNDDYVYCRDTLHYETYDEWTRQ